MKNYKSIRVLFVQAVILLSTLTCFGQEATSEQLVGKWIKQMNDITVIFTISAELTYEVEFAGDEKADVWGSCKVAGTRVTFNDEGGEYAADVPGVYEFKRENDSLMLKKVNDPVGGRSMLVEGSWVASGDEE
jgi:hypothetical protein